MGQKLHFISGLPRSGSTLLGALLAQNPRFHAGMSSGLYPVVATNIRMMSAGAELSKLIDKDQRKHILSAIFNCWYEKQSDKDVIFDTNRGWANSMPLLQDLYPEAKVIACVRDVPWIMDSMERVYRKNPYENTALFGPESDGNMYARMTALIRNDRLVGSAWANLKEAFYGEQAANLLVVDYDLLAQSPEKVLPLVYQFLDEPWFDGHDFENVDFDAPEFDEALGASGLHKIRPKVSLERRQTLLPPDLFEQFKNMDFWRDLKASRANVIVASKGDADTQ